MNLGWLASNFIWWFALIAPAYLLGSIPFGIVLTRAAGLGDLRKIGSGNIGATNVMRTGHKGLGVLTLLLDAGKGFAAVYLAQHCLSVGWAPVAALFAVLGHVFPIWLNFKGGKGVATAIGVLAALSPIVAIWTCIMWLIVFLFTRISSLSSIVAIGCSWMAAYLFDDFTTAFLSLCLSLLIIYTHRANIDRLLHGTEHAFRKNAL